MKKYRIIVLAVSATGEAPEPVRVSHFVEREFFISRVNGASYLLSLSSNGNVASNPRIDLVRGFFCLCSRYYLHIICKVFLQGRPLHALPPLVNSLKVVIFIQRQAYTLWERLVLASCLLFLVTNRALHPVRVLIIVRGFFVYARVTIYILFAKYFCRVDPCTHCRLWQIS